MGGGLAVEARSLPDLGHARQPRVSNGFRVRLHDSSGALRSIAETPTGRANMLILRSGLGAGLARMPVRTQIQGPPVPPR